MTSALVILTSYRRAEIDKKKWARVAEHMKAAGAADPSNGDAAYPAATVEKAFKKIKDAQVDTAAAIDSAQEATPDVEAGAVKEEKTDTAETGKAAEGDDAAAFEV
jgi:hypothetical protein